MTKKEKIIKELSTALSYILVAAVAVVITLAMVSGTQNGPALSLPEGTGKLDYLKALLEAYYIDIDDVDMEKLEDAAAGAMVDALGDRWSYYVSAEEFELFEEAAQMLIEFLGRLHEAQNPAPEKEDETEIEKKIRNGETPSAVSKTRLFAFLPLAHLGFGGELFWKSFCQAWEYLLLFVTELLAVFAIGYSVWHGTFGAYFGAGAALLVFCWLISIWDKFRRSDRTLYGRLALFPLTNIAYLAVCLWKNFVPFYFIAALAVFGCMAGGIYFLFLREWHIAAICAGMSYLVSVIAGFLTRGEKSE